MSTPGQQPAGTTRVPSARPADNELPSVTGSLAITHGPIARALQEYAVACGLRGVHELPLVGHNDAQRELVDWIAAHHGVIPDLRGFTSLASPDWRALNNFLVTNNFEPLFTEFGPPDLGISSIVKTPLRWQMPGTHATLHRMVGEKRIQHPAFLMPWQGVSYERLSGTDLFDGRLFIPARDGYRVCLAMLPEEADGPRDGGELLKWARQMFAAEADAQHLPDGVVVPKINLDQVSELDYLCGMNVGTNGRLTQARQHTRFFMDQKGALLEAAFAGVVARGDFPIFEQPKPLIIDRHFVLAVVDRMASITILYLHPDDSWGQPPIGVIK